MLTQAQTEDLEYCKKILLLEIDKITQSAEPLKARLTSEVLISLIYLKTFSAYIQEKQFDNLEDSWKFMNDIKGIIEKTFYVKHYVMRLEESLKASTNG